MSLLITDQIPYIRIKINHTKYIPLRKCVRCKSHKPHLASTQFQAAFVRKELCSFGLNRKLDSCITVDWARTLKPCWFSLKQRCGSCHNVHRFPRYERCKAEGWNIPLYRKANAMRHIVNVNVPWNSQRRSGSVNFQWRLKLWAYHRSYPLTWFTQGCSVLKYK